MKPFVLFVIHLYKGFLSRMYGPDFSLSISKRRTEGERGKIEGIYLFIFVPDIEKKHQQYIGWLLYISRGGKLLKPKPFTQEGVHTGKDMIWI